MYTTLTVWVACTNCHSKKKRYIEFDLKFCQRLPFLRRVDPPCNIKTHCNQDVTSWLHLKWCLGVNSAIWFLFLFVKTSIFLLTNKVLWIPTERTGAATTKWNGATLLLTDVAIAVYLKSFDKIFKKTLTLTTFLKFDIVECFLQELF